MTQTQYFDFDTLVDRRGTSCAKWDLFDEDIIPMWVADMDFKMPPAVQEALHAKVEHGILGYEMPRESLKEVILQRLHDLYDWDVAPEAIVYVPGVVAGFNMAAKAFAQGHGMLIQPPVYPPFAATAEWSNVVIQNAPLKRKDTKDGFTYTIDLDAFEAAITPDTRMFLLCSPHNPVGRVWTRDELLGMAEICVRHNVVICSDEIHNDLILDAVKHIPTATLSEEIAQNTVTLMAPSKTYNIPGLEFSYAIIENAELRERYANAALGLIAFTHGGMLRTHVNSMGTAAAEAAYRGGDEWLRTVLDYIRANRDFAQAYIHEHMPALKTAPVEGTYLLWIDCREANLPEEPGKWFRENAKVAMNEGSDFGEGGAGHVRMNLACTRDLLKTALEQMRDALADLS